MAIPAAGNFDAALIPDIKVRLEEMFIDDQTKREFDQPFAAAQQMLGRLTARVDPILENGVCTSVKAWFYRDGTDNTVEPSDDCTIPTGAEFRGDSKTFSNNLLIDKAKPVDSFRCNDLTTFVEESALALNKLMHDGRQALNAKVINLLANNIQPDLDPAPRLDDPFTNETGNWIGIPIAQLQEREAPRLLRKMERKAYRNDIRTLNILDGSNFYDSFIFSGYTFNNDNGRAENLMFGDSELFFDLKNLDSTLSPRFATFLYDPNVILFWNTTFSNREPQLVDPKLNTYAFTVPDPVLRYRKNGQLVPVEWEVEMNYACTGRNTLSQRIYTYNYYVRLRGGLGIAPAGLQYGDDEAVLTGILGFEAVNAG